MRSKPKKKLVLIGIPIAILLIAAVLIIAITGKSGNSAKSALSDEIDGWIAQWLSGDSSSLSSGMIFGVSSEDSGSQSDDEMMLSQEELTALLEEHYSALLEDHSDTDTSNDLFAVLMKYTTVTYKLPSKIEDGQAVNFTITGPDMSELITHLDSTKTQSELILSTAALLQAGSYETRTVEVSAPITKLDNGYRLEASFELVDGLYGGLLSILRDSVSALPAE